MREENPSDGIRKMLWKISSELDADRICIFELDEGSRSVSNTYEWCKNGIEPMREKMQHLPVNPYYIYWNFHKKPYPHGSGLREVSAQYPPLCGGAAEDI
ncbi:hypothetical protein [uncultured Mitsuokella sp.]|uniref:hypothetical protein n=1 Tax=uncultured Mitsuokella sp. TaxID=453120 RepID=UPI0025F1BDA2|nr:hypothetical protein [uncultured Mitsuokella sp.]